MSINSAPGKPEESTNRNLIKSVKSTEIYHIGLIDYLQKWDTNKKVERFIKTKFKKMNGQELSAIEPKEYQRRFIDFMSVVLEKPFGGNPFDR